MSDAAAYRLTLHEFEAWQARQDVRCELVDGRPVAMTGATSAHDRVAGNILLALRSQFRANGNPCDAFGPDIGLVINAWTLRRPDVAVYCPPFDDEATTSDRPRFIAEILPRSTERLDQVSDAEEYKRIDSLGSILLVNPQSAEIGIWRRSQGGAWIWRVEQDLQALIAIPDLGVSLSLASIYERANLVSIARPRLIWPDDPPER